MVLIICPGLRERLSKLLLCFALFAAPLSCAFVTPLQPKRSAFLRNDSVFPTKAESTSQLYQSMVATATEDAVKNINTVDQPPKKPSKFSGLMAGDDSILSPEQTKWPPVSFPPTVSSSHVRTVTLPDDVCPVDPPPAMHHQRELHYVPSLLSPKDVATIRTKLDPVMQPSHSTESAFQARDTRCVVLVEDGELFQNDHPDVLLDSLVHTLLPVLYDTIVPTAQAILGHNKLVLADALIRSYDPTEQPPRNTLAPHYDQTSYASVICPLNDPLVEDIQGGLYVQSGASIHTRQSIDFETVGDGLLHTYDVMHGVHVEKGNRLSLVVWLVLEDEDDNHKDATATTTTPPMSWIERDARTSVHAAFLRGIHAQEKEGSFNVAQRHFEWAAERGHALSQYCLSNILIKGQRLTQSNPRAADLLVRAAGVENDGDGLISAQYDLGISLKNGYMGLERNPEAAKVQFRRAAQQGCRLSQAILNDPSRWV